MISCLCVTHERPEFMPWVEHQFLKNGGDDLMIIDSSVVPWVSDVGHVVHAPSLPGIAEKRSRALSLAQGEFITWFDDDDWQHPDKLLTAQRLLEDRYGIAAVGARHGYMYSTLTGKCSYYESRYEPIIFNSATYLKRSVPQTFNASLVTGEDTDWHDRWLKTRPTFVTLGEPQHAWLCHTKNITNKSSSKFFELANPIPFDDWERDFLKKLVT